MVYYLALHASCVTDRFPVSMTCFAGTTTVPVGSAISTGVDESRSDSFANQKSKVFVGVDSERPAPIFAFLNPQTKMNYVAFQSLSPVNPYDEHECLRI